jgi:hypothetical protein
MKNKLITLSLACAVLLGCGEPATTPRATEVVQAAASSAAGGTYKVQAVGDVPAQAVPFFRKSEVTGSMEAANATATTTTNQTPVVSEAQIKFDFLGVDTLADQSMFAASGEVDFYDLTRGLRFHGEVKDVVAVLTDNTLMTNLSGKLVKANDGAVDKPCKDARHGRKDHRCLKDLKKCWDQYKKDHAGKACKWDFGGRCRPGDPGHVGHSADRDGRCSYNGNGHDDKNWSWGSNQNGKGWDHDDKSRLSGFFRKIFTVGSNQGPSQTFTELDLTGGYSFQLMVFEVTPTEFQYIFTVTPDANPDAPRYEYTGLSQKGKLDLTVK